jgi:glycosyltransferase involved in cell wall biosynthesis
MRLLVVLDKNYHTDERVKNETMILADAGFDITVLSLDFNDGATYPEYHKNIAVVPVRISRKKKNRLFFFSNISNLYSKFWARLIARQLKEMRYDAIHLHDLYMLKAALLLKKEVKIPVVLDLHENYPEAIYGYRWATRFPNRIFTRPAKWRTFAQNHLHKSGRIIVLSQAFKEQIARDYPKINPDTIHIYPNVPDIEKLLSFPEQQPKLIKQPGDFFILYFGGVADRRGVYTAIESLEYIKSQNHEIKLLLIGPVDGNEKSAFMRFINQPKYINKVVHIPWIDFEELPTHIRMSDICLSPIVKNAQHESGVANKVFQYMLFQKPIIVSDCKPQAQIAKEENCGLIFRSGDAADLAKKINKLIEDKSRRKEMGLNGEKAVLEKYNIKTMGKGLINMYLDLDKKKD